MRCSRSRWFAHMRSSDVFPLPAGAEMTVTFRAAMRSRAARTLPRAISRGTSGPPFAGCGCGCGRGSGTGTWSYVATPSSSPGQAALESATLASAPDHGWLGAGPCDAARAGQHSRVSTVGSARGRGVRVGRQDAAEIAAGGDVELGEDLAQVVLDGARGQEQPSADLRVGQTVAGQPGNLGLLRSQLEH